MYLTGDQVEQLLKLLRSLADKTQSRAEYALVMEWIKEVESRRT